MKSEDVSTFLAKEAEEAEEAELRTRRGEHDTPLHRASPSTGGRVYSVRIPEAKLTELKELAEKLDEPPTALMRRWVLERLDAELQPGMSRELGRKKLSSHDMAVLIADVQVAVREIMNSTFVDLLESASGESDEPASAGEVLVTPPAEPQSPVEQTTLAAGVNLGPRRRRATIAPEHRQQTG